MKNPRSEPAQKRHEQKVKQWAATVNRVQEIYEQTLLEHCLYTLCGENAMGKILTVIRDQGGIDYPLYFFEHEIR